MKKEILSNTVIFVIRFLTANCLITFLRKSMWCIHKIIQNCDIVISYYTIYVSEGIFFNSVVQCYRVNPLGERKYYQIRKKCKYYQNVLWSTSHNFSSKTYFMPEKFDLFFIITSRPIIMNKTSKSYIIRPYINITYVLIWSRSLYYSLFIYYE